VCNTKLIFSVVDQGTKTVNSCHIMQQDNYSVLKCSSILIQSQRQIKVFTSGDKDCWFIVCWYWWL